MEPITETYDQMRARVAREGVEDLGKLLAALSRIKDATPAQRARRYERNLVLYRRYLYWARRLNPDYEPPAATYALARTLDPSIE